MTGRWPRIWRKRLTRVYLAWPRLVRLAPTDAALGQAFVSDNSVPLRIRQTLSVESGLNDGLAVPFIVLLLDIARAEAGVVGGCVVLFASLVGLGAGVGVAAGWLGGRLLSLTDTHHYSTRVTMRLSVVSVAAIAYAGAESLGGNGFVAAFTAGLVIGSTARELLPHTTECAEAEGRLLTLLTFLLVGAIVVAGIRSDLTWRAAVYALVSLLVVPPMAVGLALLGSGLSRPTVGFLASAEPRGLASIVYIVLIAESSGVAGADRAFAVASWTFVASIYLHGTTAAWASARYGVWH